MDRPTEEQAKKFKEEFIELCERHRLCPVPTYEKKQSAHDSMFIVPFESFWKEFYQESLYREPEE